MLEKLFYYFSGKLKEICVYITYEAIYDFT